MRTTQPAHFGRPALAAFWPLFAGCFALAFGTTGHSAQATASDQPTGLVLEMVTITASAGENVVGSSSTVSLLDRKILDRFAFRDVAAALDSLAGMAVQRTYLKQRLLTSRGIIQEMYANKNLVMIDGVPLWHAVSGEHNLDRVGLPELRRIEALKGPASVLYGSQAYTGAVNLVLRKVDAGERAGEFYSGVGRDGANEGGIHARIGTDNGFGVLVAANGARGPRSHFRFTDESGKTGDVTDYLDTSNLTVRATYKAHTLLLNRYDHREGLLGATPTFAQGAGGRHDVEGAAAAYKLKQNLGVNWTLEGLAFYDWNERDYTRIIATGERARIGGYRSGGGLKAGYTVSPALTFTAGGDYEHRYSKEFSTYTATTLANSIPGRTVWERSALGQLVWKEGAFNVIAGTRYTENALSGGALTSRATGVYKLSENRSVKLIAAQAFRSPSLVELYSNTSAIRGNPALKPETSDSLELAYVAQVGDLFVQALGYYAKYADKIFRVPYALNPAVNTYANGAEFNAVGVELEARYSHRTHGDLFLNLDWIRGGDGDAVPDTVVTGQTSYNFKYIPRWNAAAGYARRWGAFSGSLVARYTPAVDGPRKVNGRNVQVDGFLLLDATVGYEHKVGRAQVRHSVSATNLLDADVAYPEFSRRRINQVPLGADPGLFYRLSLAY
jgi:outer membrane receptor protein involved in Fe transport